MKQPKPSPADAAFEQFSRLRGELKLTDRGTADLGEADTRAKLIDPVFKWVLGWREVDLRREEPVAEGCGCGYPDFSSLNQCRVWQEGVLSATPARILPNEAVGCSRATRRSTSPRWRCACTPSSSCRVRKDPDSADRC